MTSKGYFDAVATDWQAMRTEFFSEAVREKAYRAAELAPGMRVADIGAGSGFISEGLAGRSVHVVAVDPSENMLAELRERLSESIDAGRLELETRVGEAETLPFADGEMDRVMANMMLHHVEHPGAAVKDMVRVLARGGRLIITDLDPHGFQFLLTEHQDRWPGFDHGSVKGWFESAGLVDVSVTAAGED